MYAAGPDKGAYKKPAPRPPLRAGSSEFVSEKLGVGTSKLLRQDPFSLKDGRRGFGPLDDGLRSEAGEDRLQRRRRSSELVMEDARDGAGPEKLRQLMEASLGAARRSLCARVEIGDEIRIESESFRPDFRPDLKSYLS